MNLLNTVTMSLDDYERMVATIRDKDVLLDEFEKALLDMESHREVIRATQLSATHKQVLWGGMKSGCVIINPSEHTKDLKRQIDALEEENKRLRAERKKSTFSMFFTRFIP